MATAAEKNKDKSYGALSEKSNFTIVEAYKALRTNLLFALPKKEGECRKLLVTSALPGEGKTTTSVNIAITIAQTGMRTLVIDCDLRKPRVHSKLGFANGVGLTNVLSGMSAIDKAIQKTKTEHLFAISAGTLPPNPAELLGSDEMKNVMAELEKQFDFIVIDTSPINIVSDALVLSKLVDGVAIIVKQNKSSHPSVKDAVAKLKFAEANIIGFIINGMVVSSGKYYTSGSYKYKYKYYSYSYDDNDSK